MGQKIGAARLLATHEEGHLSDFVVRGLGTHVVQTPQSGNVGNGFYVEYEGRNHGRGLKFEQFYPFKLLP